MSYQDQVDRAYLLSQGWEETKGGWIPEGESGLSFPIPTHRALQITFYLEDEGLDPKEEMCVDDLRGLGL